MKMTATAAAATRTTVCAYCSGEFTPVRSTAKFCGVNCRTSSHRKAKIKAIRHEQKLELRRRISRLKEIAQAALDRYDGVTLNIAHREYDGFITKEQAEKKRTEAEKGYKISKAYIRGECWRNGIDRSKVMPKKGT